ncbi:hypothetical protein SAY86_019035 [Trapa natans]|uniref:non-specific serine/threonine protein kinase n=1 Tax=Trapa natans TaxID=22666 RepID=A0AAN7QZE8_TRANT|nr:hypothetical protein SAY86_019035 [Trapa natans]
MSSSSNAPPPDTQAATPPPDSDASSQPPPPPSDSGQSPPPSESNSSPSPPPPEDGGSGDSSSPPPPSSSGSGSSSSSSTPPPPPKSSSSSPSSSSSSTAALAPPPPHMRASSSSSTASSNLPLIIGITIGVGLLALIAIAICVACCTRKKKKKGDAMHYYGPDPSQMHKANHEYYPSGQHHHPNWHNSGGVQNMPPNSSGAWPAPPPPMPMGSGDMGSYYSWSGGQQQQQRFQQPMPPPSPGMSLGFNSNFFAFEDLSKATNGFSQEMLLGQGGFGYVHKGVLPNGKEVAVKSLKSGSGQGEREFQAEVEIISRVHHRHLVSLVGYCIAGTQRMLVYEFVPNNTMEYHLHGKGRSVMQWESRLRIAVGSAKGLAYLHEDCHPRIIHRDIKAANILLDNNFEAMVADFGLAKLSSDNNTHVSTRVMGTFGYLAPEYASSGKLTEKSDVFSFGVMLLELITGKRPVDSNFAMEDSLVDWARPLLSRALQEGVYEGLVDACMEGNYNHQEMARMVSCASASIRHSAKKRPKMSQIVRVLEGDVSLDDLNEGVKPGQSTVFSLSNGNSEYDTSMYNADMKRFRDLALSSQEFTSSEFGGTTSSSTIDQSSREMSTRLPPA